MATASPGYARGVGVKGGGLAVVDLIGGVAVASEKRPRTVAWRDDASIIPLRATKTRTATANDVVANSNVRFMVIAQ